MSLILGYANKDNAIIMSDGRAGINGSYSENYNKTMKLNENIVIGFAGIKERTEIFLNHVINNMGDDKKDYFIDNFLEMIEFYMNDRKTQANLQSSFIIIGRTKTQSMITSIVGDSTNYKIEQNTVSRPRYLTIGGTIDGKVINQIYFNNIRDNNTSIIDSMKNTISQVSKEDNSVNSNIFYSSI